MQENGYWKRFESTGAVGAYLDYKKERAGEKEAQHADNDHGAGAARDENG